MRESLCLLHTSKVNITHLLPSAYLATLLTRAEEGLDTRLVIGLEPSERTKYLILGNKAHKRLYQPRWSNLCQREVPRQSLGHLRKIVSYGDISAEVEILLELVRIEVVLTVKIVGSKPLHIENLFGCWAVDTLEQIALEVVVGESILLATTYIVELAPELLWQTILAEVGE